MSKAIEELAKQFTDELFAGDDLTDFDTLTEKNDAYVTCMAFDCALGKQEKDAEETVIHGWREIKVETYICIIQSHYEMWLRIDGVVKVLI